jgi:lactoylglutathione lyase
VTASAVRPQRLHHTNIRVTDPVPSVSFYRALGLEIVGCMDLGGSYTLYLGVSGDAYLIELTVNEQADQAWVGTAGSGHVALTVEDLDAALSSLAEAGINAVVEPFHPGDRPNLRVCFLEDPSGYRVELINGEFAPPMDELPAALSN